MERDDIIEYSLDAHHSEEAGRSIRKKIYFVTILLTIITCIEVGLGIVWKTWFPGAWGMVKWTFIALTLVKAAYIVMSFMHLGDERRNIRAIILLPYALFALYLIWIAIWESNYVNWAWETFK
jgi:cytochrome c oxidase subunit IV